MSKKIKGIICIVVSVAPILGWMLMTVGIIKSLGIIATTVALGGLACLMSYGICLLQE